MSFALEVKKELSDTEFTRKQKISCLSAILRSGSSVVLVNSKMQIEYITRFAFIARLVIKYAKDLFEIESMTNKVMNSNLKQSAYRIVLGTNYQILSELDVVDGFSLKETISKKLTSSGESLRGYLRGLFLAVGSVNDPTTSKYHLELKVESLNYANSIKDLIKRLNINAKVAYHKSKNKYIVYLKKAEEISDFLKLIGVNKAVLYFEDVRITRDFYNNSNRIVNMDIANSKKTLETANKQLQTINYLQNVVGLEKLSQDLIDICVLRMEHQEASLNELVLESQETLGYTLTKSGLNHRFRKLEEYASKIKEKRENE